MTVLEKINLINIGLSSYNFKQHVASDVPIEGYHVNGQDTKSQEYLNKINSWTVDHKMDINQKKTKAMLINYTRNYQFSTRLTLKGEPIEFVNKMKILGLIVTSDLNWNENTRITIRKVHQRMQLLRSVWSF